MAFIATTIPAQSNRAPPIGTALLTIHLLPNPSAACDRSSTTKDLQAAEPPKPIMNKLKGNNENSNPTISITARADGDR